MNTANIQTKLVVISQPKVLAKDERGIIEQLNLDPSHSVLRITSKKGTLRANHYHQFDSHTCYLISGKIRYVERQVLPHSTAQMPAVADESQQTEYVIKPGQLFYTAPMIAHAMEFLEDSEFLAITPRSGDSAEYENDIIRVTLIEPKDATKRAAAKK